MSCFIDCKLYCVFDSTLHVLVTGNGEVSNVLNWCKQHYQEHFDKLFQLSGYLYKFITYLVDRKHFASNANEFHGWLYTTRVMMMEVTGSLEEQLEATKDKAIEVRAKKTNLTKIEGIGGVMEEKLILDNRSEIKNM